MVFYPINRPQFTQNNPNQAPFQPQGQFVPQSQYPPQQQPNYPPQFPQQQYSNQHPGEWGYYEGARTTGIMKSEFDQKVHLLDIDKNLDFYNIITLVTKELDTSFINDSELKVFYQINFENVLEWANMGLIDLAKIRLSKLFAELKLEKSMGGFERILQGSTLTGSVVAPLPAKRSLFSVDYFRNQEPRSMADRLMD